MHINKARGVFLMAGAAEFRRSGFEQRIVASGMRHMTKPAIFLGRGMNNAGCPVGRYPLMTIETKVRTFLHQIPAQFRPVRTMAGTAVHGTGRFMHLPAPG